LLVAAMMRTSTLMVRCPPDPLEFPLLQNAQQADLHVRLDAADFVQEDGALVGQFETPRLLFDRPGKGPLLVTEQLALDQVVGDGGAVDLDEGRLGAMEL
jgi:hypothetical protein